MNKIIYIMMKCISSLALAMAVSSISLCSYYGMNQPFLSNELKGKIKKAGNIQ